MSINILEAPIEEVLSQTKDLSYFSLENTEVKSVSVSDTNLYCAHFRNVKFQDVTFRDTNFSESMFNNCVFRECKFKNCNLSETNFSDCEFIRSKFFTAVSGEFETEFFNCKFFSSIISNPVGFDFQLCQLDKTKFMEKIN